MNVFVHVQLFVRFYFLFCYVQHAVNFCSIIELMIRILLFVKTMMRILLPKYRTKVIFLVFHLHFVVWV